MFVYLSVVELRSSFLCGKNILYIEAENASDCCEPKIIVAFWAKLASGCGNIVIQKGLYFIQKVVSIGTIVYLLLIFVIFVLKGDIVRVSEIYSEAGANRSRL